MATIPGWTYKGKTVTEISDMPEGTYGFIYDTYLRDKKIATIDYKSKDFFSKDVTWYDKYNKGTYSQRLDGVVVYK